LSSAPLLRAAPPNPPSDGAAGNLPVFLSHSEVANIHTAAKKRYFTEKLHVFYEVTVLSSSAARSIQKHPRVVIS